MSVFEVKIDGPSEKNKDLRLPLWKPKNTVKEKQIQEESVVFVHMYNFGKLSYFVHKHRRCMNIIRSMLLWKTLSEKNAKNKLDVGEEEKNLERMQQTKQQYLGSK